MPSVIPIPELGRISAYAVPEKHACLSRDIVVTEGPKGLAAVNLSRRAPLWHFAYDPECRSDAPDGQVGVSREIDSPPWIAADHSVVVTLLEDQPQPHLVAVEGLTGRKLWESEVHLPAEMLRKEKGILTGWDRFSCTAKLICGDGTLVLVCTRYMSECGQHHHVHTAGESSLLTRFDPMTGRVVWTSHLEGVRIGEGLLDFDGLFLKESEVCDLDWQTGSFRVIHNRSGVRTWPVRYARGVLVASVDHGKLVIELFGPDGKCLASSPWKRTGIKSMRWWPAAPTPVLQLNNQGVVCIGDDLNPRWEARAKPWIWGACAREGGPIIVATNGAGGHLLAFDRESGNETMRYTPARGGAYNLVPVSDTRQFICSSGSELLCTDGKRVENVKFGSKDDEWELLGVYQQNAVYVASTGQMRVRLVPIPNMSRE